MDKQLTKAEVKAELHDRSESITRRLDGLEHEVTSTRSSVRDAIFSNPWVSIGGAALAGIGIGLLFGGSRTKKRRYDLDSAHGALVDEYLRALGEDVRRAVDWGDDPEVAVRRAFEDRTPLIVHRPPEAEASSQGFLRESLDLVLKTGFSLLVKYALDIAAVNLTPGKHEVSGAANTGDDAAVVGAAASEA